MINSFEILVWNYQTGTLQQLWLMPINRWGFRKNIKTTQKRQINKMSETTNTILDRKNSLS